MKSTKSAAIITSAILLGLLAGCTNQSQTSEVGIQESGLVVTESATAVVDATQGSDDTEPSQSESTIYIPEVSVIVEGGGTEPTLQKTIKDGVVTSITLYADDYSTQEELDEAVESARQQLEDIEQAPASLYDLEMPDEPQPSDYNTETEYESAYQLYKEECNALISTLTDGRVYLVGEID